jgi:lipopolysaccharide export system permease protein
MGSIGRYIFRTTLGAFLVVLISVTTLIWITQAFRDIDLITHEGQSVLTFVGLTGLIIPLLVVIIAPIAFMVAMAHVLNKLANDSELIVMNAAGMPPWHLLRPFLAVAVVVSILVAAIAFYVSPRCLRQLSQSLNDIRADLVTRIVQPGRFMVLSGSGSGLTLHIRERLPSGQLLGILIDDQRQPTERVTFLAERGDILTHDRTYLLLADGSVQRQKAGERDPNIVQFDRYAFDLSQLSSLAKHDQRYSARELYLWELYNQKPDDASISDRPEQVRAELHDRLIAPFYPVVIAVLAFAYLGAPRTTRQGRTLSLLSAIGAVALLRGSGFVGLLAGPRLPMALLVPYIAAMGALLFGYWGISRGVILEPPAFIVDTITRLTERMAERAGRLAGHAT